MSAGAGAAAAAVAGGLIVADAAACAPAGKEGASDAAADTATADQLHADLQGHTRQHVLDFLEGAAVRHPTDTGILWRLGRACVKRADELQADPGAKLALLEKGVAVLERARGSPGGDTCWKTAMYSGIVLNAQSECLGTKAQLEASPACKVHWVRAAELSTAELGRPDPTVLNLIGRWCFTFADMGWVTRRVAAAVFAVVPSSSYDEALGYFKRAEDSEPGFYLNNRMNVGKCYLRKGDKAGAKEWLGKALAMEQVDAEAVNDHAEAAELLKSC